MALGHLVVGVFLEASKGWECAGEDCTKVLQRGSSK